MLNALSIYRQPLQLARAKAGEFDDRAMSPLACNDRPSPPRPAALRRPPAYLFKLCIGCNLFILNALRYKIRQH